MDKKELSKSLEELVEVMEILRSPQGCPWDRQQDYYSLQPYIIEEAYEVVEALQKKDLTLLKEELGDLLLQVIFEAQIGSEKGDFNLQDVIRGLTEKLIRRHPHVFQDKEINTLAELKKSWAEIKLKEKEAKGEKKASSLLAGISKAQPALNQAYEVQAKAAEVGFDWDNVQDVVKKIKEELTEVQEEMGGEAEKDRLENEIGDLLFAVVNLSRFYKINPELALLRTVLKFKERFAYIEKKVQAQGYKMTDLSLAELDAIWEEAKENLLRRNT